MDPPRRPVPALMEEVVEDVLLRFPPDDPARLLRAALVCKTWCRLVSGAGFRRRFRELHRTAPMLGFLRTTISVTRPSSYDTVFVPTSSFRPPRADSPSCRAIDALHGHILLYSDIGLILWNPITGEERKLPRMPWEEFKLRTSAALLCADHLNCGYGCRPSNVVVVGINPFEAFIYACVYSSEQDAWSKLVCARHQLIGDYFIIGHGTRVANAVYFVCHLRTILQNNLGRKPRNMIIEYDLGRKKLSLVGLPSACKDSSIALMTAEGGRLGFSMAQGSKLYMWSRRVDLVGEARWSQERFIELDRLHSDLTGPTNVLATSDGVGIVFIHTLEGIFTVDLMSGRVRKLCDACD
ncbi:hypothetical protein ACP70R_015132 [Stipagrostis hirtigluma subsp. patula]